MDYKGVGVVFVRTQLREAGASAERAVTTQLTDEELRTYTTTTASSWVPIEHVARMFDLAAPVLHPGKPLPLRLLGRELARDNLRGVYRVLLRVMSVEFVISQSARLWGTYHRRGAARLVRVAPREVDFVVSDYPRLPERFRECMCGWIVGTLELVGAQKPLVTKIDDDPSAWHWHIRWQ
ncbi:MAG: DUF2378 family protein [Sandaracinaceae bacterium]|nr:DUF2378 family protein [Sandaracinaceae bacterium]